MNCALKYTFQICSNTAFLFKCQQISWDSKLHNYFHWYVRYGPLIRSRWSHLAIDVYLSLQDLYGRLFNSADQTIASNKSCFIKTINTKITVDHFGQWMGESHSRHTKPTCRMNFYFREFSTSSLSKLKKKKKNK